MKTECYVVKDYSDPEDVSLKEELVLGATNCWNQREEDEFYTDYCYMLPYFHQRQS